MTFPGATASPEAAAYLVVGAPLDVSSSFRPGSRFGPRRLRELAEPFEDFDHRTGARFSELGVADAGDVHAWDDASDYLQYLEGVLTDAVDGGALPLLLGGCSPFYVLEAGWHEAKILSDRRPIREVVHECRDVGFESLNLDLIYGLPFQTRESFAKTVAEVISGWRFPAAPAPSVVRNFPFGPVRVE